MTCSFYRYTDRVVAITADAQGGWGVDETASQRIACNWPLAIGMMLLPELDSHLSLLICTSVRARAHKHTHARQHNVEPSPLAGR